MECTDLQPPNAVRGMLLLKREVFKKSIKVPALHIPEDKVHQVMPLLKKFLLKMERLKPVQSISDRSETESPVDGDAKELKACRLFLLHPLAVKDRRSLPAEELLQFGIDSNNLFLHNIELTYDNWRADEVLKAILPANDEGLASFSRIGHIVHVNLRDNLLPYKQLIGQVLCDKICGCRTVVNKASSIDNTYRNFEFELLCGDDNYQVETKENGLTFEFDFSRVYWNPRLSTEHERITLALKAGDVLYDVFAGVGPFAVPAAKKRCHVLANDLNPESYRWLKHNLKRNKCEQQAKTYNMDGRAFIVEIIKEDLLRLWRLQNSESTQPNYHIHITMNLPALSVEFLSAFRHLLKANDIEDLDLNSDYCNYPLVHVYTFAKGENTKQLAVQMVEHHLGATVANTATTVVHYVRNVAPNKDMYRVTFQLTKSMLTTTAPNNRTTENNNDECTVTGNCIARKRDIKALHDTQPQQGAEKEAEDQDGAGEPSMPAKVKCGEEGIQV